VADSSQKSEQPTKRRIDKSREKGQFAASREFVAGAQFLAFVAALSAFGNDWLDTLRRNTRYFLMTAFHGEITVIRLTGLMRDVIFPNLNLLFVLGGILVGTSLAAQLLTTQLGFAPSKLAPDFGRLNPASRLKGLWRQNIPSFFQALILLPLFLLTVWVVVSSRSQEFLALPLGSVEGGAYRVTSAMSDLLWKAAFAFFIFGCVDLVRQQRHHNQDLRMSKQEVRDEVKESEGNPQIKMRVRKLQRDLLRRNMMKEIEKATAVIVNPTHYAVAIRYRSSAMAAPTVVAKGKNYLALRIRARALEHQIPIVENVALAQALYASADIGQEIPSNLYRAVAEVLAYIYRLMGKLPGQD
jgi:flagellar biosynthesis protein FlhB